MIKFFYMLCDAWFRKAFKVSSVIIRPIKLYSQKKRIGNIDRIKCINSITYFYLAQKETTMFVLVSLIDTLLDFNRHNVPVTGFIFHNNRPFQKVIRFFDWHIKLHLTGIPLKIRDRTLFSSTQQELQYQRNHQTC